jgi:hypothetical protein
MHNSQFQKFNCNSKMSLELGFEFFAASILVDDDDLTRLTLEELEVWCPDYPCFRFMRSYGLMPWSHEDCEEALDISRGLKECNEEARRFEEGDASRFEDYETDLSQPLYFFREEVQSLEVNNLSDIEKDGRNIDDLLRFIEGDPEKKRKKQKKSRSKRKQDRSKLYHPSMENVLGRQ